MRALLFLILFLCCLFVGQTHSMLGFLMMIIVYGFIVYYYSDEDIKPKPFSMKKKKMIITTYNDETQKFKTEVKCLE